VDVSRSRVRSADSEIQIKSDSAEQARLQPGRMMTRGGAYRCICHHFEARHDDDDAENPIAAGPGGHLSRRSVVLFL
jgi:hypothetical protein